MSDLVFDPVGSAKSIPNMIANDTLIEVLDSNQLSQCLKHITLDVNQSIYILEQVKLKYNVSERLSIISHIFTNFGEGDKFDSNKFVEFLTSFGNCLRIDIFDSIVNIVKSIISKNNQALKPKPQTIPQTINKNIELMKQIQKSDDSFSRIYDLFNKLATENDKEAILYGIRNSYYNLRDKDSRKNILIKASEENNLTLLRFLTESNVGVDERDKDKCTALIIASQNGHYDIVKHLLSIPSIEINARDKNSKSALIYASINGHHEIVKLILTVPGIDVNVKDNENYTALIWASWNGHHEVVKLLLTVPGIEVSARDNYNRTALHLASYQGHHEVVKLLLTVPGIDVNAKDDWSYTPLMAGSRYGHYEVVRLLLSVPGIYINSRCTNNHTALYYAKNNRHSDIQRILREHGAYE